MKEELLKGLTEEQIKKIQECKTADEVLALAKTEGIELNDEQLEAVSGGCGTHSVSNDRGFWQWCPKCNQQTWCINLKYKGVRNYYRCCACANEFWWP